MILRLIRLLLLPTLCLNSPVLVEVPEPKVLLSLNVLQGRFVKSSLTIGGMDGFAQIVHLSYSKLFTGISLISPTFYRCGGTLSSMSEWRKACGPAYVGDPYPFENSSKELNVYAKQGKVGDLRNLKHQKIYIFNPTRSEFADFDMSFRTLNIYEPLLAKPSQTRTRVWTGKVLKPEAKFSVLRREYEAVSFLVRKKIKFPRRGIYQVQPILRFNQRPYFEGDQKLHKFADEGFLYIPGNCIKLPKLKCLLRIIFLYCRAEQDVKTDDYEYINQYMSRALAEANNIIYVFPQIKRTQVKGGYHGCFDFFGYTGSNYATKDGIQIRIIRNMLEALMGKTID